METPRPSGPASGTTLAVAVGLAFWGAACVIVPWRPAQLVGAVLLALAVVALGAFLTAPARARRRRQREAWADVVAGTRALYGEAPDDDTR